MHTDTHGNPAYQRAAHNDDNNSVWLQHHGILVAKAHNPMPRGLGMMGDRKTWKRTADILNLPAKPDDDYSWYLVIRRALAALPVAWIDYHKRLALGNTAKLVRYKRELINAEVVINEEMRRMEILLRDYFVESPDCRNTSVRYKISAIMESLLHESSELIERVAESQDRSTRAASDYEHVVREVKVMLKTSLSECYNSQNAQLRDEADLAFVRDLVNDMRDRRHEVDHNTPRPEYLHHGVLVLTEEIAKARIAECKAKSGHAALSLPHDLKKDSSEWEAYEESSANHREAQRKLQSLSDSREHLKAVRHLDNFEPGTAVETRIPGVPMHPRNEQPRIIPGNQRVYISPTVIGIHKEALVIDSGITVQPPKHATLYKEEHGYRTLKGQ